MRSAPVCLRVAGNFACFTRPEFHVERVSYPVITPSAARGIFEAILMKPIEKPEADKRHNKIGFRWVITRIGIVKRGTSFSILRNELGYAAHQSPEKAKGYEISSNRAQRHSLILRDVEYLIEAVIEVPLETRQGGPYAKRPSAEFLARNKYHQMFLRRARAGQCFYQPFLGCREFSVREWELDETPPDKLTEHESSEDFGMMFRDFDFDPVWNHWSSGTKELASPRPTTGWSDSAHRPRPTLIHAKAVNGWITIPAYGSNNGGAS
jgi:CRISPR-associated protein Cas5d